jgi:outer membrane protein
MEEINREAKAIDLHSAQHRWLPDLGAGAEQAFSFGSAEDNTGLISNQKMSANTSFSVSSSMPLFTGFQLRNDIRAKRYSVLAAEESLKKAKENIAIAVAQAFLDVLLRKEIYTISEETVSLTLASVKKTEVMVSNGSMPPAQLYEIKARQASDEAQLTSAGNNVALGLLTLAQLLELAGADSFDVAHPQLDNAALTPMSVPSPEATYRDALAAKPQIREAELQLEGSKALLKVAEAGYWPQLNLSMGLSDRYFYTNTSNIPNLSAQLSDNLQEYVGLSLRIPLFNRFATRNSVRSAQIGISSQQLTLEMVKKTLYKEIQQAYHNAVAAQKNYLAARKTVEAAREAFRYADTKYHTGKSSVYEYGEAQTALARSLAEESQSKFSYVFAVKILDFYSGKAIAL